MSAGETSGLADTLSRPLAARLANLPEPPDLLELPTTGSAVPDSVIQAASEALARGETHYTDRAGVAALRTLVAERLSREIGQGHNVDSKVVTITCGLIEARAVALRVLLQPGTAILCPQPIPEVRGLAQLMGAPLIERWSASQATGVAYLTPADSSDVVEAILASEARYIVWDSSVPGTTAHPGQDAAVAPRVATIGSLDADLPGWRVGWVAGSELYKKLQGLKQALTICTTSVSQWAAAEWLKITQS